MTTFVFYWFKLFGTHLANNLSFRFTCTCRNSFSHTFNFLNLTIHIATLLLRSISVVNWRARENILKIQTSHNYTYRTTIFFQNTTASEFISYDCSNVLVCILIFYFCVMGEWPWWFLCDMCDVWRRLKMHIAIAHIWTPDAPPVHPILKLGTVSPRRY